MEKWTVKQILDAQDKVTKSDLNDVTFDRILEDNFKIDDSSHHYDWVIIPCICTTKPHLSYSKEDQEFYKELFLERKEEYLKFFENYTNEVCDKTKLTWPIRFHKAVQFLDHLPEALLEEKEIEIFSKFIKVAEKWFLSDVQHYSDNFHSIKSKLEDLGIAKSASKIQENIHAIMSNKDNSEEESKNDNSIILNKVEEEKAAYNKLEEDFNRLFEGRITKTESGFSALSGTFFSCCNYAYIFESKAPKIEKSGKIASGEIVLSEGSAWLGKYSVEELRAQLPNCSVLKGNQGIVL